MNNPTQYMVDQMMSKKWFNKIFVGLIVLVSIGSLISDFVTTKKFPDHTFIVIAVLALSGIWLFISTRRINKILKSFSYGVDGKLLIRSTEEAK